MIIFTLTNWILFGRSDYLLNENRSSEISDYEFQFSYFMLAAISLLKFYRNLLKNYKLIKLIFFFELLVVCFYKIMETVREWNVEVSLYYHSA